jgi:4-alpha-glucanotransferase
MSDVDALRTLADLHGIERGYHDTGGRWNEASPDALIHGLKAVGVSVPTGADCHAALASRRHDLGSRLAEPTVAAWDGHAYLPLRLGADEPRVTCRLELESGESWEWSVEAESLPIDGRDGRRGLGLGPMPAGYHTLHLKAGKRSATTLLIAAPTVAYAGDGAKLWGLFLPLYALRTANDWGAGDLSDLEELIGWTARQGGGLVGTLPLLAAFLDQPYEPSPYAPASRLFWNEFYVDPLRLPEADLPGPRALLSAPELPAELAALRRTPGVDYRRLMEIKRQVFAAMASSVAKGPEEARAQLAGWAAADPDRSLYAAFRATGERQRKTWQGWPDELRNGHLTAADYDAEAYQYHLWAQWAVERQLTEVATAARRDGQGLYLDLPLGVHSSGYDVWRHPDLFAAGAAAGAPPDAFFTQGQNWGFPPMRPERARETGYAYLRACLRHHLTHAGALRIDHVMQLHRLFWIPQGVSAADGVYVRYPAGELYAILALESHRHRALVVGENLGTVPPEVNADMRRHGILGMYVTQYELAPGGGGLQRLPSADTVASLNTHDMPPFRAFWNGADIHDLADLGFFDRAQAEEATVRRQSERAALAAILPPDVPPSEDLPALVLRRRLAELAQSAARIVLINLEDLWGETAPQNVPGTQHERPNWQRKARFSFEEFSQSPAILDLLAAITALRRGEG